MREVRAGFTLQPDAETLEASAPAMELAELFEVMPETLWADVGGEFVPNGFHRRFTALARKTGKPFVAHGVGLSMGTDDSDDAPRRGRWLRRVAADHAAFRFRWYTEHLGASALAGQALALPLPLPMDAAAVRVVRRRLREMKRVVSDVGVENNVAYFTLGAPLEEPGFLNRILAGPRTHLLLDLHNVHTMAVNHGFDPLAYVSGLDLMRVIEIHVSGGSWSRPEWLPSRRRVRLDGHDDAVPDAVWRLLDEVAPRCPRLRAIVLERMEGTIAPPDVALLREEMRRVRRLTRRLS